MTVRSYSTNVLDILEGHRKLDKETSAKLRWLGVELEVEVRQNREFQDVAYQANREVDQFAILKHDGSLHNGFEIVSVPGTYAWHKSGIWDRFLNGAAKDCKAFNTGTCGMHVHVDRVALGNLNVGKILVFLNAAVNRDFILAIAGRYNTDYCKIKAETRITTAREFQTDHYNAASLSRHGTLEIRIFKGNVSALGFYRNIEFVDALASWASDVSFRSGLLTYHNFCHWFSQNHMWNKYPTLGRWLMMKHFINHKKRLDTVLETDFGGLAT